jgi:hypothetical protein
MTVHVSLTIVRGDEVIFQVERVEVNVELPPDTFTLKPSTSPGSGK